MSDIIISGNPQLMINLGFDSNLKVRKDPADPRSVNFLKRTWNVLQCDPVGYRHHLESPVMKMQPKRDKLRETGATKKGLLCVSSRCKSSLHPE